MEPEEELTTEKPKLAVLAGEVLHDVQKLVEQQVELVKVQLFEGWGSFKPLALWVVVGTVSLLSAGLLFSLTLVFVLHESTQLPLWACYGITVIFFLVVGGVSLWVARQKSKELSFENE